MQIWINGAFVDEEQAKISVFDSGLQHGVGLFETMSARHGRVFRVDAHMHMLVDSARELLLTERLKPQPLAEAVQSTVERNGFDDARIRLTMTGGTIAATPGGEGGRVDPTIVITAQPPTAYPNELFEKGVIVTIADGRLNPLDPMGGHKTLNYWARIRALQVAAARGAGEALWFTVSNHLAGGSVSNVFVVQDDELLMPIARGEEVEGALPAPVRPGRHPGGGDGAGDADGPAEGHPDAGHRDAAGRGRGLPDELELGRAGPSPASSARRSATGAWGR